MEPEVSKLLLITYTASFPIIKSLIRLEDSAAGAQSAAQKMKKTKQKNLNEDKHGRKENPV